MPTTRRAITAAVLAFVAGLLILFPARAVYHWVSPPGIALSGLGGSIWSGSARDANIAGVYLRDTTWRLKPHRLLLGQLEYSIEASTSGGFIDGVTALSFGGKVHFKNLRGSIPLAALEQASGVKGIRGTLNAEFDRLLITDGLPVAADGRIEVTGLVLPLVSPAPLGAFLAEFFAHEDGVIGSVQDTDATVDVAGRLTIRNDRSYEFLGQLAPKPETPPRVRQQMQFLGSPNERGQYELRLEGVL